MAGISFSRAKLALPSLCFGLMQNVSTAEQETFGTVVIKLDAAEMEDVFKANSLGLALMNVVGEAVLRQAVNMLREDISAPPRPIVQSIATLQLLRNARFASAEQVIDSCVFLANKMTNAKLQAELAVDLKKIEAMTVAERQKVLYLSAALIGRFGESILQTVLQSLPENDRSAASQPGAGTSPAPPHSTDAGNVVGLADRQAPPEATSR